jgi:hypothetical protein
LTDAIMNDVSRPPRVFGVWIAYMYVICLRGSNI